MEPACTTEPVQQERVWADPLVTNTLISLAMFNKNDAPSRALMNGMKPSRQQRSTAVERDSPLFRNPVLKGDCRHNDQF